jgi:hypothetical protein
MQGNPGSCGSVQISWAEHRQNRAHADVDEGHPLVGAAALRLADLARQGRPPPTAPDKRARLATVLLGEPWRGLRPAIRFPV